MAIENGYIGLELVKGAVDLTSAKNDAPLERAIEAASRAIDDTTGRRFWRDDAASPRVFRVDSCEHADVDDFDPADAVVIKTDDNDDGTFETTWDDADVEFDPLNAAADGVAVESLCAVGVRRFPTCGRRAQLQVTARWGWPAVPKQIEQACLLVAIRLFSRKDAPFAVIGGTPEMAAVKITKDPDVRELLNGLDRRTGFA